MMTSHTSTNDAYATRLKKNELNMPKWVSEQNDRIGPKPPPPPPNANGKATTASPPSLPPKTKNQPEPDYEVIEFSGQQYSNEVIKTAQRPKTPDLKLRCTLCGSNNAWVTCVECASQIFCAACDGMFHKHPKRKNHTRKAIEQARPPLPPKVIPGQPGPTPPVAPPRRTKRGLATPLMQRKDQVNAHQAPPPSPTPSTKNGNVGWQERVASLKRGPNNILLRPLPDLPKTPTAPSEAASSRSTTPKSVFDSIQRPPSVVLERIKSKANATLDRMALLQQRYRQQKEGKERNGSIADQHDAFDQWSSISSSTSHFRSGSMSSGLNSSHFDLTEDSNLNLFQQQQRHLQQQQQQQQHQGQPMNMLQRNNGLGVRGMSTSVFNLNQTPRRPAEQPKNNWMTNQMQQAQSMAQLNCTHCNNHQQQQQQHHPVASQQHWQTHQQQHQHPEEWCNNQFSSSQPLNRSNLSLNVGPGFMMPAQHQLGMYPPPVFMNQRQPMLPGHVYPCSFVGGMPVMNPGLMGVPPASRSRAASHAGSRADSPAMSRKSMSTRRVKRSNFVDDELTDDEDSDQDDRRSLLSNRSSLISGPRSHSRRLSNTSQALNYPLNESEMKNSTRRRSSVAKLVQDWTPGRRGTANSTARSSEPVSGFVSPQRIYSDLDSESSGTRALVQAKIQQKLDEAPEKQKKQTTNSVEDMQRTLKKTAEVQVADIKNNEKEIETSENEKEAEETAAEREKNEDIQKKTVVNEQQNKPNLDDSDIVNEKEESLPSLGPPPSTPDHEWECEFCTFVNEPKIKICAICCKTPSGPPARPAMKSGISSKPSITPNEIIQPKEKIENTNSGETWMSKAENSSSVAKISKSNSTGTRGASDNELNNKDNSSHRKLVTQNKKQESLEDIWTALDENIQATADQIKRKAESKTKSKSKHAHYVQKVSTGCGTSPVRELLNEIQAKETGTSPPPQSISTQTYDVLPVHKVETSENGELDALKLENRLHQYNTEYSLAQSPLLEPETMVSITNMERNLPYYRDMSAFVNEREHYRSANDLRYSGFNGTGDISPLEYLPLQQQVLGRRQSSTNELFKMKRAHSQLHQSPLHHYPSEYSSLSYHEPRQARDPKTELYILLKEAEYHKFTPEELHAALKYCGTDIHPVQWLRDNWPKLILTVQSLATKYGQERIENIIGTISQAEARDALRMHGGNIWQAVTECIEQRQRKFRDISKRGNFSREDIVTALTAHKGNVDLVLNDLNKSQLKPFLMRIWGSPGGVENESGAPITALNVANNQHGNKNDIHEFLSANAAECFQTPIGAVRTAVSSDIGCDSAFYRESLSSQSPFNDPFTLFNNKSNNKSDNISVNSSDSKEYASTAFSLDTDSPLLSNKNVLKDLEILIGNMEQKQASKQPSLEDKFEQFMNKREMAELTDIDGETMRILVKSPLPTSNRSKGLNNDAEATVGRTDAADVKNFVWQHIQEIVPNLVQQVEMELLEDANSANPMSVKPPSEPQEVKSEDFIMQEVIRPNLREANIREELPTEYVYAAEIANFRMEFDRLLSKDCKLEYDPLDLKEAHRVVYRSFVAPPKNETQNLHNKEEENEDSQGIETIEKNLAQSDEEMLSEETSSVRLPLIEAASVAIAVSVANNRSLEPQCTSTEMLKDPNTSESSKQIQKKSQLPRNIQKTGVKRQASNEEKSVKSDETEENQDNIKLIPTIPIKEIHDSPNLKALVKASRSKLSRIPVRYASNYNSRKELAGKTNVISEKNGHALEPSVDRFNIDNDYDHIVDQEKLNDVTVNDEQEDSLNNEIVHVEQEDNVKESDQEHQSHISHETNEVVITHNANLQNEQPDELSQPDQDKHNTLNNQTDSSDVDSSKEISFTNTIEEDINSILNQNQELIHENQAAAMDSQNLILKYDNADQQDIDEQDLLDKLKAKSQELQQTNMHNDDCKGNDNEFNTERDDIFQDVVELSSDEEPAMPKESESAAAESLDEDDDEAELYSVYSENSNTEDASQRETLQSPTSESEMLLVLGNGDQQNGEGVAMNDSQIVTAISSSSSTITDNSVLLSQTLRASHSKEFLPSGEASKQNLSELVEDTHRLIRQMRDEINIDDFESTDDEDDYTYEDDDEEGYTDEYDDEDEYDEDNDDDDLIDEMDKNRMDVDELENINEQEEIEEEEKEEEEEDVGLQIDTNHSETNSQLQDTNDTESIVATIQIAHNLLQTPIIEQSSVYNTNLSSTEHLTETTKISNIEVESENNIAELPAEVVLEATPIETAQQLANIEIKGNSSMPTVETVLKSSDEAMAPLATTLKQLQTVLDNTAGSSSRNTTINTSPILLTPSNSLGAATEIKMSPKQSPSKIPKPKETISSPKLPSKKLPARSKSFSGPPTPIGISSVKAIQQKYLSKQSKQAAPIPIGKTSPPAVIRKKSITEAINKLTTKQTTSSILHSAPSPTTSLFRSRTQIRIPKKKYHETCFSDDDYETTTDEEFEPEPLEVRQRKQSMPVFRTYASIVQKPEVVSPEQLANKFVEDQLVSNLAEAQIAAALVNMKFQQDSAIWAAKECSDLDQAIALLQQECELCMGIYAMNQIISMLKCTHKCCKQCAKAYFTVQITDRSINDCNCPFCKLPELHDHAGNEDESLEYFSNLDILLKNILDSEVHELFQRKLRDRTLLKDPNFKWCIQCSSGFFARPKQKRLICPDCGSVTCSLCRKTWEKQHEGIACEQYLEWQMANDPEIQAQGVQEHLAQNGIDCPKCKFRYSLARGGCMHFTCTQCKFEFCYGCAKPFMMGAKCTISLYCAKLGLHAHHPRNCLFYLRDKLPLQLQYLLKENGVAFDVEPIQRDEDKYHNDDDDTPSTPSTKKKVLHCPIPLQKETPGGLVDTVCNSEVPENHAGMCRTHYVEYLTGKVAKAKIDPLPIFDLTDCVQELRRRGIPLPERGPWDTDEIYKTMCAEIIKKNIPLGTD